MITPSVQVARADPLSATSLLPHDGGLAVVALVGNVLLFVLGARLTIQAIRTRRRAPRPRAALWEYFTITGTIGLLYGGLKTVGVVAGVNLVVLDGLLLAFVVAIAFTMREAYYNSIAAPTEADRLGTSYVRRLVELLFVSLVLVASLGPLFGDPAAVSTVTGVAALLAVLYGLLYQRRRIVGTATRGTLVDSLLRLTVPVLVFAAGAVLVGAFGPQWVELEILQALESVFVLLAAGSLLAVTIKLGSHVRGL